ncbi:twin-arginine translocase TatA/TatE family subunit [Streptomyces sp. NPDC059467]|uniref:twin-arginine translocase TatA/TatE family subunit n=1 Tax=Streptomyces sp. NPDC059467 TaxID=3346844 RepID=UPI0036A44354
MLRNGLDPWHLLVWAIVIILLFGSKKLPAAARGLGKPMRGAVGGAEQVLSDLVNKATVSSAVMGTAGWSPRRRSRRRAIPCAR